MENVYEIRSDDEGYKFARKKVSSRRFRSNPIKLFKKYNRNKHVRNIPHLTNIKHIKGAVATHA